MLAGYPHRPGNIEDADKGFPTSPGKVPALRSTPNIR
jgi:hypothetical protein